MFKCKTILQLVFAVGCTRCVTRSTWSTFLEAGGTDDGMLPECVVKKTVRKITGKGEEDMFLWVETEQRGVAWLLGEERVQNVPT